MISGVSQQLYKRHLQIGGAVFTPVRHDDTQTIQHQAAEAGLILGQVIDRRLLETAPGDNYVLWTAPGDGEVVVTGASGGVGSL